jgi:tetratricopeptide (TPR) repeat protein
MHLEKLLSDFYTDYSNLTSQGRNGEAIWSCEQTAVQALNCLGLSYCTNLKDYKKSLETFESALKIDPSNWHIWSNLTHVYSVMGDHDNSVETAMRTIQYSRGEDLDPYYNAGVVLANVLRYKESEEMYRKSLNINPNHAMSNFNLGLSLLRRGEYEEGFRLYDYRFFSHDITSRFKKRFLQPEWEGQKIKKKSLLVYSEQGLGDFIFFSRFIKRIRPLVGKIICEVQEPIAQIVRDSLDVDEVISRRNNNDWPDPPKSDYCISVCSLPKIFKTCNSEDFFCEPYFKSTGKIKLKCPKSKMKIGICWGGNSDHTRDFLRSMPILAMKELIENKNVQCYSLMKGVNTKRSWPKGDIDLNEGIESLSIIDMSEKIQNFTDLAHIIESLDLVITVDTGLAHLCGAMGKPVWILLAKHCDWRWFDDTETTPWYTSARLFRCKTTWEDLIHEVVESLPINQKAK